MAAASYQASANSLESAAAEKSEIQVSSGHTELEVIQVLQKPEPAKCELMSDVLPVLRTNKSKKTAASEIDHRNSTRLRALHANPAVDRRTAG